MKKLFLTGIGFFLAMSLTFAQQTTPEENTTKIVTELVTKLTLNDDQKAAISTIVLDQEKAVSAVLQDANSTADAKKESIAKLQGESDSKIAQVLTDEQKAAYQKYIEERPAVNIPATSTPPTTQETKEQNESGNEQSN